MNGPLLGALLAFVGGFVAGYATGKRAGARAASAPAVTPAGGPMPIADRVYEGKLVKCGICGRDIPFGALSCPICNPPAQPQGRLEATIDESHRPLDGIVPMPGLSSAAKLSKEAGAQGYLHIIAGPMRGQSVMLGAAVVTLGRDAQNSVVLRGEGVSHRHAELHPRGRDWIIRDLGSKNGTFVNDVRVTELKLSPGDILSLGDTKMFFQAL